MPDDARQYLENHYPSMPRRMQAVVDKFNMHILGNSTVNKSTICNLDALLIFPPSLLMAFMKLGYNMPYRQR